MVREHPSRSVGRLLRGRRLHALPRARRSRSRRPSRWRARCFRGRSLVGDGRRAQPRHPLDEVHRRRPGSVRHDRRRAVGVPGVRAADVLLLPPQPSASEDDATHDRIHHRHRAGRARRTARGARAAALRGVVALHRRPRSSRSPTPTSSTRATCSRPPARTPCASARSPASTRRRAAAKSLFLLGGLFADEWNNGDSFIARQEIDQRVDHAAEQLPHRRQPRAAPRAAVGASRRSSCSREYNPTAPALAGRRDVLRAGVHREPDRPSTTATASCSARSSTAHEQYGTPITTTAAFERALAHADSGLALITGTTADDVRVRNALQVIARPHPAEPEPPGRRGDGGHRRADDLPVRHAALADDRRSNQIWIFNNIARRYSVEQRRGHERPELRHGERPARSGLPGRRRGVPRDRRHADDARRPDAAAATCSCIWPARETPGGDHRAASRRG